jgi:hypothetical protein
MAGEYRFVVLDGAMRPVRELKLTCVSDDGAMILAEVVDGRALVEVWRDDRMVGRSGPGERPRSVQTG